MFIMSLFATLESSMTSRHSHTRRNAGKPGQATLMLPPSRPRNPLVPAARMRQAGPHRVSRGALRAAEHRSLRAELSDTASRASPAGDP